MSEEVQDGHKRIVPWIYDLGLWIFTLCLDVFFREICPRSTWRVPRDGPVIVVAAPHANQFVDSIILMRILKTHTNRRVSFLIADKSMKEPYIGAMAGAMGALPVARSMDKAKPGKGTIYLPHPDSEPALIYGIGTDFTKPDFMPGGKITLPKTGKGGPATQTIREIIGPTELELKGPFDSPETTRRLGLTKSSNQGIPFKVAPHIDQSQLLGVVLRDLLCGGCIGMFPEGGSHDRPNLLPFKPGAAIMALEVLSNNPDCGLTIIPCGMNYFHAHKFRSRAVIEFGPPIKVHPNQIDAYKRAGKDKRNAVGSLLETIHDGLAAVTQLSPDHETLQLIQATRRLYSSNTGKNPLPLAVEFNRRLLRVYNQYQNDPRVLNVNKAVIDYNSRLHALGIKDRQVQAGDEKQKSWWALFYTFCSRLVQLFFLALGTIPGLMLFWPVFVSSKLISIKKARAALAASEVKLQGRDIMCTWKILVAMGLAPALYTYYTVIVTAWLQHNRHNGQYTLYLPWCLHARTYIPDAVPLWAFATFFFGLMITLTFAALHMGEIGMDILKSLPPLLLALNPRSAHTLPELREHRKALSAQVTELIDTIGPEVFADFDEVKTELELEDPYQSRLKSMPPSEPGSRRGSSSSSPGGWLGRITGLQPLMKVDGEEGLREVNRRIKIVQQERGSGED